MKERRIYCGTLGCLLGLFPLTEGCDKSHLSEEHNYNLTGQVLGYNPDGTVHGSYQDMLFTLGFLKNRGLKPQSSTRNIDFDKDGKKDIGIKVGNGMYGVQPSGNLNVPTETLFWTEYNSP